ncbi:MAG: hypothetical protein AVDCRST_MAG41-4411, partial [uncultured Corynebacteriales bacterium]
EESQPAGCGGRVGGGRPVRPAARGRGRRRGALLRSGRGELRRHLPHLHLREPDDRTGADLHVHAGMHLAGRLPLPRLAAAVRRDVPQRRARRRRRHRRLLRPGPDLGGRGRVLERARHRALPLGRPGHQQPRLHPQPRHHRL